MNKEDSKKTVLIVEDNDMNMNLFDLLLTTAGYQTIQSCNGSEVMGIVESKALDLIVMDIQLPGRSGIDLTKELKANDMFSAIPVIAVTAFSMVGDEEKMRAAGCDDYLAKPLDIEVFLETVARHMP